MVCGFPRICIIIYGTLYAAITSNILSSNSPAAISFIIDAPLSILAFATSALKVSIDNKASGKCFKINSITGTMRSISSVSVTNSALGLLE
ncbi:hypothetical protein D3C87_1623610 [compost metagenome]